MTVAFLRRVQIFLLTYLLTYLPICLRICKYWNLKVKYNFGRNVKYLKVVEFDSKGNIHGICKYRNMSVKMTLVELLSTVG